MQITKVEYESYLKVKEHLRQICVDYLKFRSELDPFLDYSEDDSIWLDDEREDYIKVEKYSYYYFNKERIDIIEIPVNHLFMDNFELEKIILDEVNKKNAEFEKLRILKEEIKRKEHEKIKKEELELLAKLKAKYE